MHHGFLRIGTVVFAFFLLGAPLVSVRAASVGNVPQVTRTTPARSKVKPKPVAKKTPKRAVVSKNKVTEKSAREIKSAPPARGTSGVISAPVAPNSSLNTRDSSVDARRSAPTTVPTTRVRINGVTLSTRQLQDFESQYSVRPQSGEYWYDPISGLHGVVGQGSSGFLLPGHEFGTLTADASSGDSGVFFNGRELTAGEVAIIDRIIGTSSPRGRYWFDALGNVGPEGIAVPLVNLYTTAQASGGGGGGGGDNFWSSRFSAGNYDSGNTRGYVSVPGYGPVGYGF